MFVFWKEGRTFVISDKFIYDTRIGRVRDILTARLYLIPIPGAIYKRSISTGSIVRSSKDPDGPFPAFNASRRTPIKRRHPLATRFLLIPWTRWSVTVGAAVKGQLSTAMPYNFNLPERLWLSFWRNEQEEPLGFQFRHEESPSTTAGYRNAGQEGLLECTQSWRTLRINIYNLDSRRPRVRRIRVSDCQTRFTVAVFSATI